MECIMPNPGTAARSPDGAHILLVGQDRAGHWIVRETLGLLGGIFISRAAALRYARAEQRGFARARVEMAALPLPSLLAR
jgi:hypothetical protein